VHIEADGASPEEVAAIIVALEGTNRVGSASPPEPAPSRWRAAARAFDDGYDLLRRDPRRRAEQTVTSGMQA